VKIDEKPELKAQYILTGSHQLNLREAISQSLAGRTALLTLLPFSFKEIPKKNLELSRDQLMFRGFMPRLIEQNIRPERFYRDYYMTYVERDVRRMISIENQQSFELFLRILAGRVGYFQRQSQSQEPGVLIYDGELELTTETADIKNFRRVFI
jgi:predicted AAA+ superfamily ATPase